MSSHTIRLHRVVRSSPEKVYRAFLDADADGQAVRPFRPALVKGAAA